MSAIIATRSISRRFGRLLAVDGLSLEVPAGKVYGFLGPNGSGKTTTIRMLLGLIRPDQGEIQILGESLPGGRQRILSRVGALVETPSLYGHLTGRENLEVTRRLTGATRSRIDAVLAQTNIAHAASQAVKTYSLGMKQRLGLALALLNDPRILILDEPTNGLDPAGIREMRKLIRDLPRNTGTTVFLSSHLLHEVEQVADVVGIINKGRLLYQGPAGDLEAGAERRLEIRVEPQAQAIELLRSQGWTEIQVKGPCLSLAGVPENAAAGINRILVENGLAVSELKLTQATLEQRFFHLTGKVPEAESA